MAYQQKLIHIHTITAAGANGAAAVATGFRIVNEQQPNGMALARQNVSVEVSAADPSGTFRWWLTAITTAGFTFNWAGANAGVCDIRVVAQVFHSICFDISTVQAQY